MLISNKKNFIFVHIYKTAGSSIRSALEAYAPSGLERWLKKFSSRIGSYFGKPPLNDHAAASSIIAMMGREKFDSYYSFAFVRNPWDWQVSLYNFMLKDPNHHQHEFAKQAFRGFDDYIRWRCSQEVRFQKDFIYSREGDLLIDYIRRFEHLDTDFASICTHLSIKASLPRLNVSNTRPYQEFYNRKTRALVEKTFAPDIELFEYNFE